MTGDERERRPTSRELEVVEQFLVPDLGEGLQDATITSWAVAVGDHVELNQTLCTLETNKAEVEIPSPYAGRIVELGGADGDTLEVGAVLVRIATQTAQPDSPPMTRPDPAQTTQPEPITPADSPSPPSAENGAAQQRKPVLVGYGTDDQLDTSRRPQPAGWDRPAAADETAPPRPRAAPPVRKLAADLSVDLSRLAPGSGAGGLITREDVLAAAGGAGSRVSPVRGIRARMAKQMTLSRSQIPDAHASVQVDGTGLLRLRDRFRDVAGDEPAVAGAEPGLAGDDAATVTPFVLTLRLLVIALSHHPVFNSTWVQTADGAQIHTHGAVNLGFGVATPRGLLVPVIADAQEKTTRELARRVADLVRGARDGSLIPTQLQGSTFTVSNFGALGLDEAVPVINYPEAAILGIGSLKPRPVVVDDRIVARPTMTLTCAFDHRIADGAQVAAFLGELRRLIEAPETALLDL